MEPDIQLILERSGMFHKEMSPDRVKAVTAFYRRKWSGKCSLDDICLLGAEHDADPKTLIEMAEAAGELECVC